MCDERHNTATTCQAHADAGGPGERAGRPEETRPVGFVELVSERPKVEQATAAVRCCASIREAVRHGRGIVRRVPTLDADPKHVVHDAVHNYGPLHIVQDMCAGGA